MNISLLRKARATIRLSHRETSMAPGALGCIASFVIRAADQKVIEKQVLSDAARLLNSEVKHLTSLFYIPGWPDDERYAIMKLKHGTPEYAEAMGNRVENFIKERT